MRGHLATYVLAVALAAGCSGCAMHSEYDPKSGYAALETITNTSYFDDSSVSVPVDKMKVRIVSIQRVGDQNILTPPSDKKKVIYLQPGQYTAKIDCEQPYTGKGVADVVMNGTPMGDDHLFTFALTATTTASGHSISCAKTPGGQIFVSIGDYIEVVGT